MGLTLHFPVCLGIRNKTQPTMPQPSSQNPLLSVGLRPSRRPVVQEMALLFQRSGFFGDQNGT